MPFSLVSDAAQNFAGDLLLLRRVDFSIVSVSVGHAATRSGTLRRLLTFAGASREDGTIRLGEQIRRTPREKHTVQ